ncbi:NCA2-domain-containing protein [Schizopora paradoxa]|uniref:NCA2-domain-containing protein n=1 Tax=Schizopora paradoxa TaxID=27342 RepID=A0A0H2S2I1_9AGAM|nr:NCA2-domain-containing protein [Schizopora paradoxa]
MSSFAASHVQSIISASHSDASKGGNRVNGLGQPQSLESERLYSMLVNLNDPLDHDALRRTLDDLSEDSSLATMDSEAQEDDQAFLKKMLEERILVGTYARSLDLCLQEAIEADSEADWWANVERSWKSVTFYLLATLPVRLQRALRAVIQELRIRNIPLTLSSFTPRSLRELFPPSLHPTALTTAFFPHLKEQAHLLFSSPIELARLECKQRRQKLLQLRNDRANELGELVLLKREIEDAVKQHSDTKDVTVKLQAIIGDASSGLEVTGGSISVLKTISSYHVRIHVSEHQTMFTALRRPSRLTLLWPRLALLPPAGVILFRVIYGSRDSIAKFYDQGLDTLHGFWTGYVIGPMKDILNTVRTGGDNEMRIVSQEGVRADLDSLERMALALSKDKLLYNDAQLAALSDQIRQGDLTPVLKVYEEDIKSPLRSAIAGSLVRSLLIQIQKAKVDLDQALSGIDKLLKSQELTFAFVGVAPSLAIVYGAASYLSGIWSVGHGNKKYGGRRRREVTWQAIRRVERLLVNSERKSVLHSSQPGTLSPLTSGLLLISISQLRSFAENCLPRNSSVREGFLEDVADLEDPELGRDEKQLVVERMWRSWGGCLGWRAVGRNEK